MLWIEGKNFIRKMSQKRSGKGQNSPIRNRSKKKARTKLLSSFDMDYLLFAPHINGNAETALFWRFFYIFNLS